MELNNKLMYYRRTKNLKDTSQHENYMCFRNELYNNKPMVMTPSFYDTLPNYGSLDFDFVQFSRPMPDILPMSDNRFKQLVAKLYLDRMELAVPLSFRRAPTPAVRTLNPKVYDELIDLQRFRTRIPELYNRDIATPIEFTPPKEQHDITPERVKYSGRRLLLELQALFCSRWITTRQALYVLAKWPLAFGTTKVDAALMLFDRILDLYNYSQVFTALVDSEVAQLIFRLGWLNMWSPLIPEMYYELDLTIYEQREVTKVLVQLAMDEPGENWQGATFGWDRDSPMPGWVLNMSWLTPGNFPQKGYLRVEYYSGADKGCSPVWASRHTSAQNVLAELPKQFDVFLAHREALRRLGRRGSSGENDQRSSTQSIPTPPSTNSCRKPKTASTPPRHHSCK
ncbi:hypothetical protein AaE_013100 [Aphanomyces astaci]|uniref:Uncharacterized protein n=1 Tax=Aphanomyces astaci TaxID=112090 RepID=A0A6A4ZJM4_APHAT|nr:hypothetical protein AaE_013100 [Aphanomyces astaci]